MALGFRSPSIANFKLGPCTGSERLTLTAQNGQVTAIKELFGIQFQPEG